MCLVSGKSRSAASWLCMTDSGLCKVTGFYSSGTHIIRIIEFVSELDPNQLRGEAIENVMYNEYTFFILNYLCC